MQEQLGAYIAIRAINEYANSALPNAPVRPDEPQRRTLRRLFFAAARLARGTRASVPAGRIVGRTPPVRRPADKPSPGVWPGPEWQAAPGNKASRRPTPIDPGSSISANATSTADLAS